MGTLLQDLRYGLRMLAKNPGFTAVAMLTLALGIGATTAIFSVVNSVLLRPLPYPQPEQIVGFSQTYRGKLDMSGFTAKQFDFWKSHAEPFQYLAATTSVGFNIAGGSQPERVRALRVSKEYFHVLGVPPALGRDFLQEEDRPGGPNVALLSQGLWARDFGAGPHVIGRTILLDGEDLVLLVGSGLLIRTLVNLLCVDPGFEPHHVLSLQIWTTGSRYKSSGALAGLYEDVVRRIKLIPGVESAAVVGAGLPLEPGGNVPLKISGQKDSEMFSADYREITPEYFRAMGVAVKEGHTFTSVDSENVAKIVTVNAAFARQHFSNRSPLGEHLDLRAVGDTERTIVAVVGDVRSALNQPAPPTVFIPLAQASYGVDQLFQGWFPISVLVRTAQKPASPSGSVETALRDVAPDIPIGQVRSMEEVLSLSFARQRFLMILMTVFAGSALMLAAVGIYGVLSYFVNERTHEVGIRMALGASRREVLWLVVNRGLRVTFIGVVIGMVASFGLTRILGSMLFGVRPTDPLILLAVSFLLMGVALVASYLPARRAMRVDPIVALRYE